MAKKLLVEIIGDASKLTRSFNQSTTAANKFGAEVSGSMGKAEKSMVGLQRIAAGGFIGGAAVSAGIVAIKETTQAASDLAEQVSKNQQVFGASAAGVEDWSETTAKAFGISQTAALEATGTFGNLFRAVGITGPKAAEVSQQFVKLAADLASFNNASPEDTLNAIRSGLVGEVEPLRRYGVLLSEARVQQVALAQTGKDSIKQLTVQEKALARIAIIMRDTATAQGDFERTSGGLANQQRILAAQTADLQANLGQLLLPAVTSITEALVDATSAAVVFADGLSKLGSIKIPTIVIPVATRRVEIGGGTVGGAAGKGIGLGALGYVSPAALFATLVKKAVDEIRGEAPPSPAINDLAAAFDDQFSKFTDQAVAKLNETVDKAVKKGAKAFGEKGFKVSEANELGESLQRAFDATLDALDLKFDRAVFTENTAGALALLDAIEKAIRERIKTEGRTTELLRLLFEVEQKRAAVIAAAAATRKANADKIKQDRKDAAAAIIDALEFGVTEAQLTPFLKDDIAALNVLKKGLEKQIAEGKNVVENQRRLVVVTDQIADLERERTANLKAAAASAAARQQFRRLGVGPGGEEFIPGIKNLRKQFKQISDNPELLNVPKKLRDRLALIGKELARSGKKLEPEVRKWISDTFGTIRSAFDKEAQGPLTKTTSLNANKIIAGLGLGPEATREIRARLASFNSAGLSLTGGNRPAGTFRGGVPVVENHNTISIDGEVVGRSVTKSQQKRKRRNPTQKRGPNGGV